MRRNIRGRLASVGLAQAHPNHSLCFLASNVEPVTQQYELRAVQKSTSAIKVATMKNINEFHCTKEEIPYFSRLVTRNTPKKCKLHSNFSKAIQVNLLSFA